MNMSTKTWGSTHSFSMKQSTIVFRWKFGWQTFSRTLSIIIGKKTPISAFNPALNLETRLIKMEHDSWKMIKSAEALFFKRDRHRYCLMAPKNLLDWKKCDQILACNLLLYWAQICEAWKKKKFIHYSSHNRYQVLNELTYLPQL